MATSSEIPFFIDQEFLNALKRRPEFSIAFKNSKEVKPNATYVSDVFCTDPWNNRMRAELYRKNKHIENVDADVLFARFY